MADEWKRRRNPDLFNAERAEDAESIYTFRL